jgi:trimeric autotransporter adhesin
VAAVLTGTPTAISWGTSANPAPQDVSIPSDATAVYVFASGYRESGANIPTFTLASNAPNQHADISGDPGSRKSGSVAVWYSPPTGSRSLTITWPTAQDFNASCIVAYVKGGDTSAWRDADADNGEDVEAVSVTLTTAAGDLVIKYDCVAGDPPALTSGWTSAQTQDVGGDGTRLSTISAAGATQVCDCEGEFYSIVLAVAIPAAAADEVTIATASAAQTSAIDANAKPAATVATQAAAQTTAIAAASKPAVSVASSSAVQATAVAVAAKPSATVTSQAAPQASAIGVAAKPVGSVASVAAEQESAIVGGSGNTGTVGSVAAAQTSDIDGTAAAGGGVTSSSAPMATAIAAVARVVAAIVGGQAAQQSAIRIGDPDSGGSVIKQVPHGGRFGVASAFIQWGRRRLGGDHHASP